MKTDIIRIGNDGSGMAEALEQADKVAAYRGLPHKNALHLRLLTEEMMGMMRSVTGSARGDFWIEDEDGTSTLHLKMTVFTDAAQRQKLLSAASTGKNEAIRGIMGRIRAFFDPMDGMPVLYDMTTDSTGGDGSWSMRSYQELLRVQMEQRTEGASQAWDELEKSVVTHVADDIRVSISGRDVEMVIVKRNG